MGLPGGNCKRWQCDGTSRHSFGSLDRSARQSLRAALEAATYCNVSGKTWGLSTYCGPYGIARISMIAEHVFLRLQLKQDDQVCIGHMKHGVQSNSQHSESSETRILLQAAHFRVLKSRKGPCRNLLKCVGYDAFSAPDHRLTIRTQLALLSLGFCHFQRLPGLQGAKRH